MLSQTSHITDAVEQGFNFVVLFDQPGVALRDFKDLLKIGKSLDDSDIDYIAQQILKQLGERAASTRTPR